MEDLERIALGFTSGHAKVRTSPRMRGFVGSGIVWLLS